MHLSAIRAGQVFFQLYCQQPRSRILDLGSCDVNGSLRAVAPVGSEYVGVDVASGAGVDVVLSDPNELPFESQSFDLVVSSSCFEHDPFFWLTFLECVRVLKDGGFFYLNAPSNGIYHTYPTDNWRFYPDAGLALARWGRRAGFPVEVVESFILNQMQDVWNDFVCIFARGASDGSPAHAAPAGRLYRHFAGATNIWLAGASQVARHEILTEDIKKRVPAKLR